MDGSQSLATEWRILFPSVYTVRGIMWLVIFMSLELEKVCQRHCPSSPTRKTNHPGDLKQREWNARDWFHSNSSESSGDGEVAWWLATEGRKKCSYGSLGAGVAHRRPMGACESCQSPHLGFCLQLPSILPLAEPCQNPTNRKMHPPGISPPMVQGSLPMIKG